MAAKTAEQVVRECLAGFSTGRITKAVREQAETLREALAEEGFTTGRVAQSGYVSNGGYVNTVAVEDEWRAPTQAGE